MFHFHITAHCLGCGREQPVPKAGSANRSLANVDDEAEVFLDLDTKCPQCGGTRVRVRMNFDISVDVGRGG